MYIATTKIINVFANEAAKLRKICFSYIGVPMGVILVL